MNKFHTPNKITNNNLISVNYTTGYSDDVKEILSYK